MAGSLRSGGENQSQDAEVRGSALTAGAAGDHTADPGHGESSQTRCMATAHPITLSSSQ